MNTKYDVFISYSRRDYVENDKIIPGNPISSILDLFEKNGITYWIDKDGIKSAEKFAKEISKAIVASKMLLFVSSLQSNKSEYTCGEILKAKKAKKLIIPFLIDKCDYNEEFDVLLLPLQHIDYVSRSKTALTELLRAVKVEKDRVLQIEAGDLDISNNNMINSIQLTPELYEQIGNMCLLNKDYKNAELNFKAGKLYYWLGFMEYEGLGKKRSYRRAYEVFSKHKNDTLCRFMTAVMLFKGEGVRKNDEEALKVIKEIKETKSNDWCVKRAKMIENVINYTADEATINKVYSKEFYNYQHHG